MNLVTHFSFVYVAALNVSRIVLDYILTEGIRLKAV